MWCKSSCFHVRDGALVGDLRDATQPMVWRMELSRVHAVGFRVVQNGSFSDLVIESGKGESTTIASYDRPEQAARALRRISCALSRGSGAGVLRFLLRLILVVAVLAGLGWGGLWLVRWVNTASTDVALTENLGKVQSADDVLTPPNR